MLLAELVSLQALLQKNEDLQDSGNEDTLLFGQCRTRKQGKGYTQGGLIFFSLSVAVMLLLFLVEMAGYASGEHYGNIQFSFICILVDIVFAAILMFLSKGPSGMTDSSIWSGRFKCCACWYTNSIQKVMLRLLGASEETSPTANDI
uniref:Uncharacterized protein n=1 Tax=Trieres chinensis TaxID=1514140 RepID=A0A7S1YVK3_TRICV|mmetsp:Transcript_11828/g.24635  ORF Transcript_11828/g.24635 Transcript_11828/m.24635 type:complete len:147 (+) Transcript_11828:106-546(+)